MVDVLFVVTLFAVFAICALMLVIIGADVYKKTVSSMDTNYASRTAYAYISEKIRQLDEKDAIEVCSFGDGDAIFIERDIKDRKFYTCLYLYDGSLMELFTDTPELLGPEAGSRIMDMTSFSVSKEGNLYYIRMTDSSGEETQVYVSERT